LLRAWTARARTRYVAVDVDRETLAASCAALDAEFPRLEVRGIAGTYEQAFSLLRDLSPLVLLFLGSSIGNLDEAEVDELLDRLAAALAPGDHLLLGIDLVKDVRTLEAAYNDAAGVSAAFSKNLFARMNRELATGLDLDAIEHVAYFDAARSRIEIFARFTREAVIALPAQGRRFRLAAGEMVRVEISRKFEVADMVAEAERHGFPAVDTFVDPTRSFALLLLRRRGADPVAARRRALRRELEATRLATLELVAPLDEARRIGRGGGGARGRARRDPGGARDGAARRERPALPRRLRLLDDRTARSAACRDHPPGDPAHARPGLRAAAAGRAPSGHLPTRAGRGGDPGRPVRDGDRRPHARLRQRASGARRRAADLSHRRRPRHQRRVPPLHGRR